MSETGEAALLVFCHCCGNALSRQGALMFGPPNEKGLTEKFHVCFDCWPTVIRKHLKSDVSQGADT